MTRDEAVEAARVHLRSIYGGGPPTIVMQPELSVEHDAAWAVRFDSQEHIDTGDLTQAPMVRVVAVFKDGSFVGFPPSAYTTEELRTWLATGQQPRKPF
ncbi:YrhB domain-containing protein [Streptomyces sp. Ru72]|uniref:YrhB domain-containing protein n=1 Tax=Streptomyces sp. Ru72 TaxID=2080747 RepID=UPI000CDE32B4|nr:YrhB domain-containing protein [Streptomyces sp. Ru72]POX52601.1 serine protease [Streptomyces sp. Ru72]